jgi:hypothetical protein
LRRCGLPNQFQYWRIDDGKTVTRAGPSPLNRIHHYVESDLWPLDVHPVHQFTFHGMLKFVDLHVFMRVTHFHTFHHLNQLKFHGMFRFLDYPVLVSE